MSAHTKGEWVFESSPLGGYSVSTCIAGKHYAVIFHHGHIGPIKTISDALLIAAAPNLLDANVAEQMARKYNNDPGSKDAKEALGVLEEMGYGEACPLTPSEFAAQLRKEAIAKATGNAQ